MKSIAILIEESTLSDQFIRFIPSDLKDSDTLVALYQLPSIKTESIPLIGGLQEIRRHKAQKLLQDWYEKLKLKSVNFKPLIFDGEITHREMQEKLNGADKYTVICYENQLKSVKKIFGPFISAYSIDFKVVDLDIGKSNVS